MNLQVVSAIIENLHGEILLAERPEGKHLAGLWEFPGGKVEKGESLIEALRRELKEELELEVRLVRELGCFVHVYDQGGIDLHMFHVQPLGEPRATLDVPNFRWIAPAEVRAEELTPADRDPWRAYLRQLTT